MNKLLIILSFLICGSASAQRLQYPQTYGYEYDRFKARLLFGFPADTFAVPDYYKTTPWSAAKNNIVYLWNTTTFIWEAYSSGAAPTVSAVKSIGTLYSRQTWSGLSDFINQSSGASVVATKINFAGGANVYTNTLDYYKYNGLQKWAVSGIFVMGVPGAATYGFGLGHRSSNNTAYTQFVARIDMTTGSDRGKILIDAGNLTYLNYAKSTALIFSAGDKVKLTVTRTDNIVTASAQNMTTLTAPVSVTYTYNFTTTPFQANTGSFSVFNFGGNFTLDSLGITANEIQGAGTMFLGDSKTLGVRASDISKPFSKQFSNAYGTAVINSGQGDKTDDIIKILPEVTDFIKPKQVVLEIGSNDIRYGVSTGTWQANYATIVNTLQAAGIPVYHLLPLPESSLNQSTLYNYIIANYPASRIINTTTPLLECLSCLDADGIHLNDAGNDMVYKTIAGFGLSYADRLNTTQSIRNQAGGNLNAQPAKIAITDTIQAGSVNVLGSGLFRDTVSIGLPRDVNFRFKVLGKAAFGNNRTTALAKVYMTGYDTANTASQPQFERVLNIDRRLTLLPNTSLSLSSLLSAATVQGFVYPDDIVNFSTDYQGAALGLASSTGFLAKPGISSTAATASNLPNASLTGQLHKFSTPGGTTLNIDGFISNVRYLTQLDAAGSLDSLADVILGSNGGGFAQAVKTRFGNYILPMKVANVTNGYATYSEGTQDTTYLAGLLRMPNLMASDSTNAKPVGALSNGTYVKLNSWPVGTSLTPGSNGQSLITESGLATWSVKSSGRNSYYYFNDFMNAVTANGDGNGLQSVVSGGTTVANGTTATNRPGALLLSTGTGTTGYAAAWTGQTVMTFGGGAWTFDCATRSSASLSNGTDRFQQIIGFGAAPNSVNKVDGVYFLYDEGGVATGSTASANWQCVTVSNSTRTYTTTSVAYPTSTYQNLRIEVNAAGTSVGFYIDNNLVATHTTNIPATVGRDVGFGSSIHKSLGTTTRNYVVDFIEVKALLTSAR